MANINREIAARLRGIRELSDYSVEELAQALSITSERLIAYESGEEDIPVSILHTVSEELKISMTELLTGEEARLSIYSVVRAGRGVGTDRRSAYEYHSLSYNFVNRQLDPYLITIPVKPDGEPLSLNTHSGQEFHYCLEGSFMIQIDNHQIIIKQGDSITFDSTYPHGMKALDGQCARELVVILA